MESLERINNSRLNALYNSYVQIKSLMKRDSVTLATKHVTITTIFKYMSLTTLTSHCTHIDIDTQHQEQTPLSLSSFSPCVQVSALSSGVVSKASSTAGGMSGPGYGPHPHKADTGSLGLASQAMLGFPQQRSSDIRTSQLQMSSHGQHGGKVMGVGVD